jgi:methanogenic corrinoid protein MtbC1
MTDGPDFMRKGQRTAPEGPVESLASEALKALARQRGSGTKSISIRYVELLQSAVLRESDDARGRLIDRMIADGTTVEDIIDRYIPEVARRLGEAWCSDMVSFADVTIGSARLQGMLRDLTRRTMLRPQGKSAAGVAVVVLADEYHTLGAMVLTSQLRRLGISVRLLLGATEEDAIRNVRADKFDAVLISASHSHSLSELAKFIKNLKREAGGNTPIVLGGPILCVKEDVKSVTGADHTTSDVVEALRLCRLKISPHAISAEESDN